MSAAEGAPGDMWTGFMQAALANVSAAFTNVRPGLIASIAEDLRTRARIYLAGTDTSHHLVMYLHATANMVSPGFCVAGREGAVLVEDIADIEPTDALICLSPTPPPDAIVGAARLAREYGALVIAITDSPDGPLSEHSDHLMQVPFRSPSFFASHVAAIAMIEMLAACIASASEAESMGRIQRIEAARRRLRPPGDNGLAEP